MKFHVIIFIFIGILSPRAYGFEGLAILGDSLSTGAATHPSLRYDNEQMWRLLKGAEIHTFESSFVPKDFSDVVNGSEKPVRLSPSPREWDNGSGWIWHTAMQNFSARLLEESRLSYSYFLGRKLGYASNSILIAGENGARADRAWVQASRVIAFKHRELPSKILFLFTGNDLCGQSFDELTSVEDYAQGLMRGMKYLVKNGRDTGHEVKLFIPAFLPIMTLVSDESILKKVIHIHGKETTCEKAREEFFAPEKNPSLDDVKPYEQILKSTLASLLPPNPVMLCPTVFSKMAEDSVRQSQLANRIRAFRETQKKVVDEFNQWRETSHPKFAVKAEFIDTTGDIKFEGADLADDCFHLSSAGHAKLAKTLFTKISASP